MEPIYTYSEEVLEDGNTHIMENDVETAVYTPEEYIQYNTPFLGDYVENHNHIRPYTCLYDMTPCTLEEMVNDLNAYASVMSDGRSVPVEIKKADIVRHTAAGEIERWYNKQKDHATPNSYEEEIIDEDTDGTGNGSTGISERKQGGI